MRNWISINCILFPKLLYSVLNAKKLLWLTNSINSFFIIVCYKIIKFKLIKELNLSPKMISLQ
jgi:hypothetical protein